MVFRLTSVEQEEDVWDYLIILDFGLGMILDWHLFIIWLAVEQEEDVWDHLIILDLGLGIILDWHLFIIWLAVEQEEDVWDNLIIASASGNQCTTQGLNVSEGRLNFCKIWFAQIAILSFIRIIARPCNLNLKFQQKITLKDP